MKTRLLLALWCAAMLSGCVETLFESQPAETMAACDPHFVGKWRVEPTDNKDSNDEMFLIVERQCRRWRFIEDGKEDEKLEKTTHVAFGNVAGQALLTVKADPDKPGDNDPWRVGYYYFRYDLADKTIHLRGVDDRRVAHLIVDGKVFGRTQRVSREPGDQRASADGSNELHNFVAGGSAEMARVVQIEGLFADHDAYVLKPARDAEIFKAAKKKSPQP